jgi:chromate reductase
MKVLTFAATNSRNSINKQLVQFAASKLTSADIDYVEINDFDLPIYNIDLENDYGIPNCAYAFLEHIKQADAILLSFAEHNGNFTVAFKNLFDWLSRVDRNVYQGKPIVMLSTSPGAGGGETVLKLAKDAAPFFDGKVVGTLSVPNFYENFDFENSMLTDLALVDKLDKVLSVFQIETQPA